MEKYEQAQPFKFEWRRAAKKITEPIEVYLAKLIAEERSKGFSLKVSVGTDSQRNGRGFKFATVILISRKLDMGDGTFQGKGGMMIHASYPMSFRSKRKEGVNERMITEVSKSIEAATEIAPVLDSLGIKLEIHADINPDPRWESNKALSAAVGYILGMGYEFKIKPFAWAASYSGDHYANGKS